MVESFGYPYIPGEYGIPFQEIPMGEEWSVKGGSGRDLYLTVWEDAIKVSDVKTPWFTMDAIVDDGTLSLILETRRSSTQEVHPDFYAAKFIDFAMRHFEANGVEIEKFRANWLDDSRNESTNYRQFTEALNKTGNKEEAARSTWTAKIMAKYGFTEIEEIERIQEEGEGDTIVVWFTRPRLDYLK